MKEIKDREFIFRYKRRIALVLAFVLIAHTFIFHGKNWFIHAQTSPQTTDCANIKAGVAEISVSDNTSEPCSNATMLQQTSQQIESGIDVSGLAISINTMDDDQITNELPKNEEVSDGKNLSKAPPYVQEQLAESSNNDNLQVDKETLAQAAEETKQLKPGDWLYIQTGPFGTDEGWGKDNAKIYMWYVGESGSRYSSQAEAYSEYIVRIKLPLDMKTSGVFVLQRFSPVVGNLEGVTVWSDANSWGKTGDLSLSGLAANTNLIAIQSWQNNTQWQTGTWIQADYSGETLYFENYTNTLTKVYGHFSPNATFSQNETQIVEASDCGFNVFSLVIPGEQKYVKFVDEEGNQLGKIYNIYGEVETNPTIESVAFETGTKDTLYYHVTEKANSTYVDYWGKTPTTNTTSLGGKTLYFDKEYFPVTNGGTLYIGDDSQDSNAIELQVDANDDKTLSYQFPADTTATQQTILTFKTADGTKYRFKWADFGTGSQTFNKVNLNNEVAFVNEKYTKAITVYYDATLSKLTYSDAGDYTIPKKDGTIRYYATGTGKSDLEGNMVRVDSYTADGNTWQDVYKVDLPEGYEKIAFSNFVMTSITNYRGHGESTSTLTIPTDIDNPCFYADSSDTVIYDGQTRSGYWDVVYSIRNAEMGKTTASSKRDVVDISSSTFTRQANCLYVSSTFYDYYTDYELNGLNRDSYGGSNTESHRSWVTFRHFNQALSDYYKQNQVSIPIYTGHFQPKEFHDRFSFAYRQTDLQLYGYDNYNNFNSTNNSNFDINAKSVDVKAVAQGLVSSAMNADELMMGTSSGGAVYEPHFNEDFLTGKNSKNAVLGDIYHNVSFPFTQEDVNSNGVYYWCFDSSKTTLAMKQDTNTKAYYLQDVGNQNWAKNVNSSSATTGVSNTYGFFPFNETSAATSAKNYNYGFGVKLQFKFRLTSDGTVLDADGNKVPITFAFSGDDDVWVYIDDKLVLDVGGAHGFANGTIDFQHKTTKVDYVKASAGATPSPGTYSSLTNNTYHNVTSTFSLDESTTTEHTLTMYYMERGMWESNMHIQFNFPDENNLEVEKQVDETEVNPLFQGMFEDRSLFTYHIKTQATHYGTKEVSTGDEQVLPVTFNSSFASNQIAPSVAGNTFAHVDSKEGQSNVVHWYGNLSDATGAYRDARYGVIQPEAGTAIDISKMDYLEFKYYYDYKDTPTLSNMYLQLVDTNGKIKGNITDYLAGKTYGIPAMASKKWVTVKIDLSKLQTQTGFNNQVAYIRFGYNYPRDIYLDEFVFRPSTVANELIGFITKQQDIPDYGSATSGKLEIPEGAIYQSTTGKSQIIGEDGTFVLQDKETITFSDQFRRGSYIYLEEESNPLFDTSWTMYENGQAVASMGTGTLVQNGTIQSLVNVSDTVVNDDRTETVITQAQTGDGSSVEIKNSYTVAKQPTDYETFVFRSYSYPDYEVTTTKLKVVYKNKVKVGSLILSKESLYDSETLSGTYQFVVRFYNIGGISLENDDIETTISLKAGESYEIQGIPLGTFYDVQEVNPTDLSYLGKVEISDSTSMMIDTGTQMVSGVITKQTVQDVQPSEITFKNTLEPKISVAMTKIWKDEVTKEEITQNLPSSIFVQLQRKKEGAEDSGYTAVQTDAMNYSCIELAPTYEQVLDSTKIVWKYEASGLDKVVDYSNQDTTNWVYRFVELTGVELNADGTILNPGTVVEDGRVVTIKGSTDTEVDYQVQYGTPSSDPLTGDYSNTLTNIGLSDVDVKLIKSQGNQRLPGVTFQLEKLNVKEAIYEVLVAEATTSAHTDNDTSTGGEILFDNLENGTYRLTELKTAESYTLLKEPLIIDIDRKSATYTYRMESEVVVTNMELSYIDHRPTITLTVHNTSNITLPATGVNLPTPALVLGILICMAAGILYRNDRRKCGKEGKPPGT